MTKIIIIFGKAGAGKTFISKLLKNIYSFDHIEGEHYITPEEFDYLNQHGSFTQNMRNAACSRIIEAAKQHILKGSRYIVISCALPKQKNQQQLQDAFKEARFLHVRCDDTQLLKSRIASRNKNGKPLNLALLESIWATHESLEHAPSYIELRNEINLTSNPDRKQLENFALELASLFDLNVLDRKKIAVSFLYALTDPSSKKKIAHYQEHANLINELTRQGSVITVISNSTEALFGNNPKITYLSANTLEEMHSHTTNNIYNVHIIVSSTALSNYRDTLQSLAILEPRPLRIIYASASDNISDLKKTSFRYGVDLIYTNNLDGNDVNPILIFKNGLTRTISSNNTFTDQTIAYLTTECLDRPLRQVIHPRTVSDLLTDMHVYRTKGDELVQYVVEALGDSSNKTRATVKNYQSRDGSTLTMSITKPSETTPDNVIFYLPGTGWGRAITKVEELIASRIAIKANAIVITPHHRLSPEHKAPIPTQDCYDLLCYLDTHRQAMDLPSIMHLLGYSSGGNMAIQLALTAAQDDLKLHGMFLCSPSLDLSRAITNQHIPNDPILKNEYTYLLDALFSAYAPSNLDLQDATLSPLYLDDALLGQLPPTNIVYSGNDALRGEAEALFERLKCLDVNVEIYMAGTKGHYSFWYDASSIDTLCSKLRSVISAYSH